MKFFLIWIYPGIEFLRMKRMKGHYFEGCISVSNFRLIYLLTTEVELNYNKKPKQFHTKHYQMKNSII